MSFLRNRKKLLIYEIIVRWRVYKHLRTIIVSLKFYLLVVTVKFNKSIIDILTMRIKNCCSILLTAQLVLRTAFQALWSHFLIFCRLIFLLIIKKLIFFIERHCCLIFLHSSLLLNCLVIFILFFTWHWIALCVCEIWSYLFWNIW